MRWPWRRRRDRIRFAGWEVPGVGPVWVEMDGEAALFYVTENGVDVGPGLTTYDAALDLVVERYAPEPASSRWPRRERDRYEPANGRPLGTAVIDEKPCPIERIWFEDGDIKILAVAALDVELVADGFYSIFAPDGTLVWTAAWSESQGVKTPGSVWEMTLKLSIGVDESGETDRLTQRARARMAR